MKSLTIAALVAAQISLVAQPAFAAGFGDENGRATARQGAFAGARLRVPLGAENGRKASAGLTVAPVLHGRQADGSIRTRFGEGMELRLSGESKPQLAFGGKPLSQLTQGRTGPDGRKAGISTIAWVGIGLVVAAGVVFALGQLCADGEICGDDGDG